MKSRELWRSWRRARKDRAFAELVRPEVGHALSLARRMGANDADAEDAVQETLVALSNETSDEPIEVGLRAWICRRVVMRVRMNRRASSRRQRYERAVRIKTTPPDPALAPEVRDEVERALASLDGDQRQVVLLRYLHDLDYREIAYVLGVSENACRVRVHKALKFLRGTMGRKAPALIAALGVPTQIAKASAFPAGAAAATVAGAVVLGSVVALQRDDPPPPEPPPITISKGEPVAPTPAPQPDPGGLRFLRTHFDATIDARPQLAQFDTLAGLVDRGGRVIDLGPGVHNAQDVPLRLDPLGRIVIQGAGVGKTTLVADRRSIARVLATSRGVVMRDLTYEGSAGGRQRYSGAALDVRGKAVALFERVRFRHWSTTSGHGSPVGVSGSALLLFRDCEFLGGYKRAHGGYALSVRGDTLAVFDRCRFSDLEGVVTPHWTDAPPSRRSAVRLQDCALINTPPFPPPLAPEPEYSVTTHECERRTVERPTLRDLRAVVDAMSGRRVRAVRSLTWVGAPETYFHVALDGGEWRLVALRRGVVESVDETGFSLRTLHVTDEGPALGEIEDWPDLDEPARVVRAVKGRVTTR